ncbi:MAG: hypothetical protein O3B01_30235 [Planctomycetota bacterium]|nr:hypothetical protein [Planctomycetota bacterium]MDA1142862.1 hypothetical protein [Planctomycetota bacterium]
MPHKQFDRTLLNIKPLDERIHDLDLTIMKRPGDSIELLDKPRIGELAQAIVKARESDAAVILMMGAHMIRAGNGPLIADLMRQGLITHVAMNGAGAIHDFELALIGQTCESVARYISEGQFGLWHETARLNDYAKVAAESGHGFGETLGRIFEEEKLPNRDASVLAAGHRFNVPVTVHVAIGQDIIHEHANCDGAATGAASYADFLIFTESVCNLERGVFMNYGTAVMGPEVYLKALAMARNVAHQRGESITDFTTAVFDLVPLEDEDVTREAPRGTPGYFFRPWKTILVRTVADGGTSIYVQGDHARTFPTLFHHLVA